LFNKNEISTYVSKNTLVINIIIHFIVFNKDAYIANFCYNPSDFNAYLTFLTQVLFSI